ncbi:hypothetical protein Zmor_015447 [Zophobas morio]|uniref:Peptidase S1 domain-containing protein n=1 Tax=Zophobas morio TaxID=2755281 RepID=A0AA38MHQ8_9CUCU|nr:hypothetical protein Zmor_015447 [Zophobas morio]
MSHFKIVLVVLLSSAVISSQIKQKPGSRIIGGDLARAGQFPYSASIYIRTADGTYFYSGALLNNQWVLTAGQCVDGGLLFTIRLGTNSLTANDASLVRVATDTYFLHPQYNGETLENDIGLIKFREPITYSTYIQPINYLSEQTLPVGSQVVSIGWGQISDEDADLVDHLNYVQIVTLRNFNEGTCLGDIGSPLIQYGSRGYAYHVGISSFLSADGCESTDPSGFTRTAVYRDWIRNTIANN